MNIPQVVSPERLPWEVQRMIVRHLQGVWDKWKDDPFVRDKQVSEECEWQRFYASCHEMFFEALGYGCACCIASLRQEGVDPELAAELIADRCPEWNEFEDWVNADPSTVDGGSEEQAAKSTAEKVLVAEWVLRNVKR